MNDYKSIRYNQGGKYQKLSPPDTTRMHIKSLQFIKTELIEKKTFKISRHYPILWLHGHTHNNIDYYIGNTRVLCNQRGYSPSHLNADFDDDFIVHI